MILLISEIQLLIRGFNFFLSFFLISLVSELIFILFFCLLSFHFLSFFQFLTGEAEVTAVSVSSFLREASVVHLRL